MLILLFTLSPVSTDSAAAKTVDVKFNLPPLAALLSNAQLQSIWDKKSYSQFLRDQGETGLIVDEWADSPRNLTKFVDFERFWPERSESSVKSSVYRTAIVQHRVQGTPWTATATKLQILQRHSDHSWTFDERSTVTGIPFCSGFTVHQRFRLVWSVDERRLAVRAWVHVAFNDQAGRLIPRNRIQSGAMDECMKYQSAFAAYVCAMLQLKPDTAAGNDGEKNENKQASDNLVTDKKTYIDKGTFQNVLRWLQRFRISKDALFVAAFASVVVNALVRKVVPIEIHSSIRSGPSIQLT